MFEALSRYRVVIVTGPHRSGTTICARIVERDAGLRYVDTEDYGGDLELWNEIVARGRGVVVHSPGMARWVHLVAGRDDVLVIWMLRPLAQILVSEARINWSEKEEKAIYADVPGYNRQYHVSVNKLSFWRTYQHKKVTNWREVRYEDLKAHPLWLPAEKRRHFGPRQWALREVADA